MEISLNNGWQLRQEELYTDSTKQPIVAVRAEGWMKDLSLPCDIHMALIENDKIGDPSVGLNYRHSAWTEDQSWWFKKTFDVSEEFLSYPVNELLAECLDCEADVFINGVFVKHHKSQTYALALNIKPYLKPGANEIMVRVTAGLEYISNFDAAKQLRDNYSYEADGYIRGDKRRALLRKASYIFGWDWNPRIPTCGITGKMFLRAYGDVRVSGGYLQTTNISDNTAEVNIRVELSATNPINIAEGNYSVTLFDPDGKKIAFFMEEDILFTAGVNVFDIPFTIKNPDLWWPNGMGSQPLYTVEIIIESEKYSDKFTFNAGIRTVIVNMDRINGESESDRGRMFQFIVNGKPCFCKGGNWETPDSIYARITDGKYETLVRKACEAHYTMFRFNGVNNYERDYFYHCCDKYGIMVWHDFSFSCSAYPDELAWFRDECTQEIDYQIKRLRNHPCIALWCGSNEAQWHDSLQGLYSGERFHKTSCGTVLYNQIMPRLVRELCPGIQYWNCSPFGGEDLNDHYIGNQHTWWDAFFSDNREDRIKPEAYDVIEMRFVSEFGCLGPSKRESVIKACGCEPEFGDMILRIHTNVMEHRAVEKAIRAFYLDAETFTLEEYLLYGGLFQGVTLGYAFDSMRAHKYNWGALQWSYNDCYGEVGWSLVDYYCANKISYNFARRSFAPIRLIIRREGDKIAVTCANDTMADRMFDLVIELTSLDGVKKETINTAKTNVPALSRNKITVDYDFNFAHTDSVLYVKAINSEDVLPAIYRGEQAKNMKFMKPRLITKILESGNGYTLISVETDIFTHAVHFNLPADVELSDEYFDLLPNESRTIRINWNDAVETDKITAVSVLLG